MSECTGCILLVRMAASISVDQSFAVSSGLLNLVIVLGNDVKKHSLDRRTDGVWDGLGSRQQNLFISTALSINDIKHGWTRARGRRTKQRFMHGGTGLIN